MNAVVGKQTQAPSRIIAPGHPELTLAESVLEDQGVLADGQIVAKDGDGEIIAHKKVTGLAMTGTVDGTNKVFTAAIGPFLPGSIVIKNDNETAQEVADNQNGGLVGDGTGSALPDGTVSVTLGTAPAEGKTVTIDFKTKPVGVNKQECDTSEDDTALIVQHGTVTRDLLVRNAVAGAVTTSAAADAEDIAALKAIGIYAI
jgi:hypothetical protein